MSKTTERLLQAAALLFILWFGYQLVQQSIVAQIISANRAAVAEQQLAQCQQSLKK